MQEVDIGSRRYRTGKLDAFKQFHLFRKLMPILSGLGESFGAESGESEAAFWSSLGPVATAIAEMSQQDSEFILKTCLMACTTWNGNGWVRVMGNNGEMMFEDISMMDMLQLSFEVVKDNLGLFFPGPNPQNSEQETSGFPSILSR